MNETIDAKALQPLRGMHDLVGNEARRHRLIIHVILDWAERFGFDYIETPLLEHTALFTHSLGISSDIVMKQMYSFIDQKGLSLTLRPEGTAGVVRSFLCGASQGQRPWKVVYAGPMFRRERPQKGRYRQFTQIGVEVLDAPSPTTDVDVISLANEILSTLNLKERVSLKLNTLGDQESCSTYRNALLEYFNRHRSCLSEDSLKRLELNPLRILDSKSEEDQALIKTAPGFLDYLTKEAELFFRHVCRGLDQLGIVYEIDQKLVRGLDYYSHTAFEYVISDKSGRQNAILGGGRYDGLISSLADKKVTGIGWAVGLERIAAMIAPPSLPASVTILPIDDEAKEEETPLLACKLRRAGVRTLSDLEGSLGNRLKRADKLGVCIALILGPKERDCQSIGLLELDSGTQTLINRAHLIETLKKVISTKKEL